MKLHPPQAVAAGLTDYPSAITRRRSGTPSTVPMHHQGLALPQSSLSAHGSGTPFLSPTDLPSASAPTHSGEAETAFMLASLEAMAPLPAGGLDTRHMHGADVDMSAHVSGYVSDGQALPLGADPLGGVSHMFGGHAQVGALVALGPIASLQACCIMM